MAPVETKLQLVSENRSTFAMLSAGAPSTVRPPQSMVTSWTSWMSRQVPSEEISAVTAKVPGAVIVVQLEIEAPVGFVTVTVAIALREGSAWLAATTLNVPAACGAVYRPVVSIEPPAGPSATDHATAASVEPETVAVNRCVAPVVRDTAGGEITTEIWVVVANAAPTL